MAITVAVKVPDSTGGHYELFQGITDELGRVLGLGYPTYAWGPDGSGNFGPIHQYSVIAVSGDGSNIVPLATPGAGFLLDGCPLNVVFAGSASALTPDQRTALANLGINCAIAPWQAPIVSTPVLSTGHVPAASAPISSGGTPIQGGLTTVSVGTSSNVNSTVASAISTQLTPGSSGSVPTGTTAGQTTGQPAITTIYRFIVQTGSVYNTGANYAGCSQTNTAACDPQQFPTLADAIKYALSRGEVPYMASSTAEVWGIINGTQLPDPNHIYNDATGGFGQGLPWGLIAVGLGALYLLTRSGRS